MTDFEHADWRLLDGAEIYDRFVQKGAKLGHQGNKVIREMKRKGYFSEIVNSTLAKSKADEIDQLCSLQGLS